VTPDPLEALRLPIIPVEPRPEFTASLLRRLRGERAPAGGRGATVRYFVADLDAAVAFYRDDLGFDEELRPAPSFAMLYRGDLRLLLSVPGRAHALPDGTLPDPGGWNRIVVEVPDLGAAVQALRARGVRFRHEIVTAVGVRQALLEDPSGNPVELFEPLAGYHERAPRAGQEQPAPNLSTGEREDRR
jgi:catechol 2,3-dioxygenase-like lactoylglutathione lyase family enzyme